MFTKQLAVMLGCLFCASAAVAAQNIMRRSEVASAAPPTSPQAATANPGLTATPAPTPAPPVDLLERIKPLASGYGVIVAEPVAVQPLAEDAATMAFGAGCTRWLQLELSDHVELGKMPQWTDYASLAGEVRWSDGYLSPEQVARLSRSGATHIVLSAVNGDEKNASLLLHLVSLPDLKLVTSAAVLGSYQDINTALPVAARTLLAALGAKTDDLPDTTGGKVGELLDCGLAPLDPAQPLPPRLRPRLQAAAGHLPLAGLLAWRAADGTLTDSQAGFAAATDNLAVGAFLASHQPQKRWRKMRERAANSEGAPNYLAASMECAFSIQDDNYDRAIAAAERAAACLPSSPAGWMLLQDALCQSTTTTGLKSVSGPSQSQFGAAELTARNALRQAVALRAASLAPASKRAWQELSEAAFRNADINMAVCAFERAWQLDPADGALFAWGVQLLSSPQDKDYRLLLSFLPRGAAIPGNLDAAAPAVMEALLEGKTAGINPGLTAKLWNEVLLDPQGNFDGRPWARAPLDEAWRAVNAARISGAFAAFAPAPGTSAPTAPAATAPAATAPTTAAPTVTAPNAAAPNAAARWAALSRALRDTAEAYEAAYRGVPLSRPAANRLRLISQFRRLAAARWVQLEPDSAAAWLEQSRAESTRMGINERDVREALNKALALAPLDVEVNEWALRQSYGAADRRQEMWDTLRRIADNQARLGIMVPQAAAQAFQMTPGAHQPKAPPLTFEQRELSARLLARLESLKPSEYPEIQRRLAAAFGESGRTAEARTAHEKWIRLAPANAEAEFSFSVFLAWQGASGSPEKAGATNEEVQRHLRRAITLDAGHAGALHLLGGMLLLRAAEQAAASHGTSASSGTELYAEALPLLEQAAALRPLSPEAHFNLGLALEAHHRYREALAAFTRARGLGTETSPMVQAAKERIIELEDNASWKYQ